MRPLPSLLFFGLIFLPLLAGGCGKSTPRSQAIQPVTVIATVHPLADVARQVGGKYVDVSWVIESGQSLRGIEPPPDVRNRLRSAELVLSGGAAEQWAGEGFGDPSQGRRIIRLDALNPGQLVSAELGGYLWLDPRLVIDASQELCVRLQVLRPRAAQDFRAQTDAFVGKLDELTREYQSKLASAHARKVLVLGRDFVPLLTRFGFNAVPTVDVPPMQISDAELRTITEISRANGTRLLLVPADTPTLNIRDLEVRGGLQIVPIDGLGSSSINGRNSYLEILRYDLDQLVRATTIQ